MMVEDNKMKIMMSRHQGLITPQDLAQTLVLMKPKTIFLIMNYHMRKNWQICLRLLPQKNFT